MPHDTHLRPTEWARFPTSFELARAGFARRPVPERLELLWDISVTRTLAFVGEELGKKPAPLLAAAKTLRDPRFYEVVLGRLPTLSPADRMLAIAVLAGSLVHAEAPDEFLEPQLRDARDGKPPYGVLDAVTKGRVDFALAEFERRRKLGFADLEKLWKQAQATKESYDSKWNALVGQRFRITGTLDQYGYPPLRTPVGGGRELETSFGLDVEGYALLDKLKGPGKTLTAEGVFEEISTSVVIPQVELRHVRLVESEAKPAPPAPPTKAPTVTPARGCHCGSSADPSLFVLCALGWFGRRTRSR